MRKLLTTILTLLALATPAFAHSALIASSPADGETLATAPQTITLTFTEPVTSLVLNLIAPDGSATPLAAPPPATTIQTQAPQNLATGTHILSWRVVSQDGHPIGGSVIFSIGAPSAGGAAPQAEAVDWPLRNAIWLTRFALYAALFFGVGGLFFRAWLAPATPLRASLPLIPLGLIAAPLSIALQGVDALALPLTSLTNPVAWQTGLATSLGPSAGVAFGAFVLAMLSLQIAPRLLTTAALAGLGISLAASGHANAAAPQWLTRPAVFLHATNIAFWAGALLPLLSLLRKNTPAAIPALSRFSTAIPYSIAALIISGGILAVIQLGSIPALWQTPYGLVLLAKLALLTAIFLLALYNRLRLTTPVTSGQANATRPLICTITLETALILVVFATAALWRFTPPPRVLAELAAIPATAHIHTDKIMAEITITPSHAGLTSALIYLTDAELAPIDPQALTLVLSNPSAGIEPFDRPAEKQPDGTWRIDALTIPLPGLWTARLDIRVSDFQMLKVQETIEIRP